MSFVYGTVYKGIQIGGGYYHYLPTWLDILPVAMPDEREIKAIEVLADRMIAADNRATRLRLMQEADAIFYEVYGVGDEQRGIIRDFSAALGHERRLSPLAPGQGPLPGPEVEAFRLQTG